MIPGLADPVVIWLLVLAEVVPFIVLGAIIGWWLRSHITVERQK